MRVLSGIQPSGPLHIGNYFGMMQKMIQYQQNSELYCFIADYHALTTIGSGKTLRDYTLEAATSFLALGLDPDKSVFWVQSDVPEVTELTWILSCLTPIGLMERAHSFKDKIAKGLPASMGLFGYPILMTSDIIIYQSNKVPVGKDQKQHVEIARDLAIKFNNAYGETFTLPDPEIDNNVATIPGLDGQKMSKSYNNTIEIFESRDTLHKKVMGIVTDSQPVEASKDPDKCNLYNIYKLFINEEQNKALRQRYLTGGLKYGDTKKELSPIIWDYFAPYREKYQRYKADPALVKKILTDGAQKARAVARKTLNQVRTATGLGY